MYTYDKPDNLVEMFALSLAGNAERPLFGTADENGTYSWISYREVGLRIDDLRAGLAQKGVSAGDAVGVIANNCTEWAIAAFATMGLGGRFIPMYEKELPKIWKHIINDGGIKILFVSNEDIYRQIEQMRDELGNLEHVYLIHGSATATMTDLERQGRKIPLLVDLNR